MSGGVSVNGSGCHANGEAWFALPRSHGYYGVRGSLWEEHIITELILGLSYKL